MVQKRKKRINFKKFIFIILVLISIIYFFNKNGTTTPNNLPLSSITNNSKYKTIKKDTNNNYLGKGQEKVSNKNGYFTTFTTISDNQKTYIEYKQNGASSWTNKDYWNGTMADNGCGITVMSIILSGYNKNYTPEDLRKKYYPKLNYDNLSEELKGMIYISNPNGGENDSKSSGWYELDEVVPYIAKALYIEETFSLVENL